MKTRKSALPAAAVVDTLNRVIHVSSATNPARMWYFDATVASGFLMCARLGTLCILTARDCILASGHSLFRLRVYKGDKDELYVVRFVRLPLGSPKNPDRL